MLMDFSTLKMRYEPFPIGCARPIMTPDQYDALLADYPPFEIFAPMSKAGHKWALNPFWNGKGFKDFLQSHQRWREFEAWVSSRDFIETVLGALAERHVDLGLKVAPNPLGRLLKNLRRGRIESGQPPMTSRMEFSMLPADGGSVIPHTDAPSKIITLVVTMVRPDEWDPAFGGGTDVNRPKDVRLVYNQQNRQAEFADMEVLETYEFVPNQAVVFVKTFNSWHSVRPMQGQGSTALRRTLTINIEVGA